MWIVVPAFVIGVWRWNPRNSGVGFVHSGPVILLFPTHTAAAPTGVCMIEGATLQKGGIIPRGSAPFFIKLGGSVPRVPFRFAVRRASGLALEFTADSEAELQRWVDAIVRGKFLADRIEDYPLVPVPEAVDAVADMSRPTLIGYSTHPPIPEPQPRPVSQPPGPSTGLPGPPSLGAYPPRGPGFAPQPSQGPPPGYNPYQMPPQPPLQPQTSTPVPTPPFMAPIIPQPVSTAPVSPLHTSVPSPVSVTPSGQGSGNVTQPLDASHQGTAGGSESAIVCVSCGHQLRPTARFCPSCGVSR